jgi:hypothetical protein
MNGRKYYNTIFTALILTGIVLISLVSAGGVIQDKIDKVKSSTNKEILLPKEGLNLFKFSSGNLISLIIPQGSISPYYTVNPIPADKTDWQKQNFSLPIALPTKAESISFGLYDKNMAAACCGEQPFRGRTDFIY